MTAVQLPEVPAHIGLIVGVRLTPSNTNEFFGYFEPSYRGLEKERVYTAAQLREYAIQAVMADRRRFAAVAGELREAAYESEGNHCAVAAFVLSAERIEELLTPSEPNSER